MSERSEFVSSYNWREPLMPQKDVSDADTSKSMADKLSGYLGAKLESEAKSFRPNYSGDYLFELAAHISHEDAVKMVENFFEELGFTIGENKNAKGVLMVRRGNEIGFSVTISVHPGTLYLGLRKLFPTEYKEPVSGLETGESKPKVPEADPEDEETMAAN